MPEGLSAEDFVSELTTNYWAKDQSESVPEPSGPAETISRVFIHSQEIALQQAAYHESLVDTSTPTEFRTQGASCMLLKHVVFTGPFLMGLVTCLLLVSHA